MEVAVEAAAVVEVEAAVGKAVAEAAAEAAVKAAEAAVKAAAQTVEATPAVDAMIIYYNFYICIYYYYA